MPEDKYKNLQKNKVPLTNEERAEVIKRKAVWGNNDLAVWKSVDKAGKATYVTSTHRAYNTAPTLKGAIGRFHSFIKSTANEESFSMEKVAMYEDMIYKEAAEVWAQGAAKGELPIMFSGDTDNYINRLSGAYKKRDESSNFLESMRGKGLNTPEFTALYNTVNSERDKFRSKEEKDKLESYFKDRHRRDNIFFGTALGGPVIGYLGSKYLGRKIPYKPAKAAINAAGTFGGFVGGLSVGDKVLRNANGQKLRADALKIIDDTSKKVGERFDAMSDEEIINLYESQLNKQSSLFEDMIYKEAEAEWVLTPEQELFIMANDRHVQRYLKAKKSLARVKKSDTISSTIGGAAAGTIFGAGLAKSKQYPHKVRAALGGAALTGAALGGITNKFHDKINRASYDSLAKDKRLATYSLGVNFAVNNAEQLKKREKNINKQASLFEDLIYKEAADSKRPEGWVLTPEQEKTLIARNYDTQKYMMANRKLKSRKQGSTLFGGVAGFYGGLAGGVALSKKYLPKSKGKLALGTAVLGAGALGTLANKSHKALNRDSYDRLARQKENARLSSSFDLNMYNAGMKDFLAKTNKQASDHYEQAIYKEANAFLKSKQTVKNALKKVLNKEEDSIFNPRYADDVINLASKIKPIDCEVCGYKGIPTYNGYCPRCGSLGGIKPTEHEENKHTLEVPTYNNIAEESRLSFEE